MDNPEDTARNSDAESDALESRIDAALGEPVSRPLPLGFHRRVEQALNWQAAQIRRTRRMRRLTSAISIAAVAAIFAGITLLVAEDVEATWLYGVPAVLVYVRQWTGVFVEHWSEILGSATLLFLLLELTLVLALLPLLRRLQPVA